MTTKSKIFHSHGFDWKLPFVWGAALFSMFFGAGNLIYSLWLGYSLDPSNFLFGLLGFFIVTIIFPLFSLLGVWTQQGCLFSFLTPLRSRSTKLLYLTLILLVWSPLGSMPRALLLTKQSLSPLLGETPPWISHMLLCILVSIFIANPRKLVSFYGKWVMPGLLVAIATLFFASFTKEMPLVSSPYTGAQMFVKSMSWGYQTMDGISAIFFGKLLIELFVKENLPKAHYRRFFIWTFSTAACLLTLVYLMLILSSLRLAGELSVGSPILLLQALSHQILGSYLGFVVVFLITCASLSTAIAVALITVDFFHFNIFTHVPRALIITVLMSLTFIMSLQGLEVIHIVSDPILEILYPSILLLSLYLIAVNKPLFSTKSDPHLVRNLPK